MTGYYDYVLGFIPAALFGITAMLHVAGVSLSMAVPLAAGAPVLAIGHALFVNAPVDDVAADPVPDASATSTPNATPVSAD